MKSVKAQIIPDGTLGAESSVVTPNQIIKGIPSDRIDGGAIRGQNLFHSFQEFNIGSGRGAYFSNPSGIENILTRVTGSNVSNILGTLGVLGNANLFFLNPNGIIFGSNSRLDVSGSFIASTGNSIQFADSALFSAKVSQSTLLLTLSVPIGLQYGNNSGKIQVQGDVKDAYNNPNFPPLPEAQNGLQIQPNQTLALVGGDISLEGAKIRTNGGSLELGSVAGEGLVGLTLTPLGFSLDYKGVENFGNIQLSNETNIDTSGIRGGEIQIQTGNLQISQGSRIASFTVGPVLSGDIRVNATNSVEIVGTGRFEQAFAQILDPAVNPSEFRNGFFSVNVGTGSGGNFEINTGKLILRNGAFILVSAFGQGRGGNVNIKASKSVEVIDSLLATGNRFGSSGDAGNLSLNTHNLTLQDRGLIGSSSFGNGKAGDISIDSIESIDMTGGKTFDKLIISGGIDTNINNFNTSISSFTSGVSNGGNVAIKTKNLTLRDRAQILASTFSSGNAGNLALNTSSIQVIGSTTPESNNFVTGIGTIANPGSTGNAGEFMINTITLLIENGGQVGTATFGRGNAGNMILNASDIKIIGINRNDGNPSVLSTSSESNSAAAGNLTINTDVLEVRDGAAIVVRSEGLGTAGNLNVNARSIRLDNKGFLSADTRGISADPNQQQANINLRSQNVIMLRNTNITTNARGENVIGGNININTDFLVAAGNSDISANSTDFRGGRVTINAKAIIGAQFRNALTQNSDITATGASPEFSGTVEINTPEVDPSNGLVTLPLNLVDASQQIDNSCRPGSTQSHSSFVATGRGGLPLSATEPLQDTSTLAQWVKPRTTPQNSVKVETEPQAPTATTNSPVSPPTIVEASGWVVDANANIHLVAQAPPVNPSSPSQTSASCPVSSHLQYKAIH